MAYTPHFNFYPGDWLSSTKIALMTPAQEGGYIRLLCHLWNDPDCSLPDDDETLAVLSRLGEGWLKGSSPLLRRCFILHPNKPGYLTNKRLYAERQRLEDWREKCSLGGKRSGKVRRIKEKKHVKVSIKGSSTNLPTKDELKTNYSSDVIMSMSLKELKDKDKDIVSVFFKLWNYYAEKSNLVGALTLNKERRVKVQARLKEHELEEWDKIFDRCARSPFCNGMERGTWRASFDWIIQGPQNAIKVLEGKYGEPQADYCKPGKDGVQDRKAQIMKGLD